MPFAYSKEMTKKQLSLWAEQMGGIAEAAEYLGVNYTTVWRWLKDPKKMNKATIMLIEAQFNGVPPC